MRANGTGCDQRVGSVGLEMKIRTGPLLRAGCGAPAVSAFAGPASTSGLKVAVEPDAQQALLQVAIGGKARGTR